MIVAGILAGVAGAYLSLGIAHSFAENMVGGRGFVAIAMVTFGRWRPMWAVGAALFIGALESLQFTLQSKGLGIPYQLLLALPYIAALIVLAALNKGSLAPKALGEPYEQSV